MPTIFVVRASESVWLIALIQEIPLQLITIPCFCMLYVAAYTLKYDYTSTNDCICAETLKNQYWIFHAPRTLNTNHLEYWLLRIRTIWKRVQIIHWQNRLKKWSSLFLSSNNFPMVSLIFISHDEYSKFFFITLIQLRATCGKAVAQVK